MIKLIHMSAAFISISLFLLRGFWVFQNSSMISKKWVKILPHVNDTILLIAATVLAVTTHQYPFVDNWLTAKFIALIMYIVFGSYALKRAKNTKNKMIFFILSVLLFIYIVMVALTRSVTWFAN